MEKLIDCLYGIIEDMGGKEDLSSGELEALFHASGTLKNLYKIDMYENGGEYSRDYSRGGNDGNGNSYRGNRSGRSDGGYSYGNRGKHYVRGHYSRSDGSMIDKLESLMNEANSDSEREEMRRMIENMRSKS